VAWNSTLCWIGVGRVDTLVPFLTIVEWLQFFLIKYDVGYRSVIYSIYNFEIHSFYS
jgi:hypothetical protein